MYESLSFVVRVAADVVPKLLDVHVSEAYTICTNSLSLPTSDNLLRVADISNVS